MKKAWASKAGVWLAMSWAWTGMALAQEVTVYKSPSCGCCTKWVKHMEASGFTVEARDVLDVNPYKQKLGLPLGLGSCHTAVVDGYLIEGHVPAEDIRRLLQEEPEAKGLAVPGMPMGSPGMEGPRKDRYEVLLIDKEDRTSVYARH
ncbi:MAG: DUF411 domain-containing protein [Gammaproteobacteria bacterium]